MKKLTPCTKISKEGLIVALVNGREFTVDAGTTKIHWDANYGYNPVRCGTKPWNWRGFKYLNEMVDIKWWEDPKAIGCPVKYRDSIKEEWKLGKLQITPKIGTPRVDGLFYWFIEPLTADDLYKGEV